MGPHVVMLMLQPVQNAEIPSTLFDKFFTSHALLMELAANGFRACGTFRNNRTGKCALPSNKAVERKERGYFDYKSDGTVLCVKWNDNSRMTVASNYYGVNLVHKIQERVKNEPMGLGGVDICDRLLSSYRPRLCSKSGGGAFSQTC